MEIAHAEVDYGTGQARIWGEFDEAGTERAFMRHANNCFGIRKSIVDFKLLKFEPATSLPSPWDKMQGAAFVLQHNCGGPGWAFADLIVFDGAGEKIKSEWD